MSDNWVGLKVDSAKITVVQIDFAGTVPTVTADFHITLAQGDRPSAYGTVRSRLYDFLKDSKIENVVIVASAVSTGGTRDTHLHAAELRGVVMETASRVSSNVLSKKMVAINAVKDPNDVPLKAASDADGFWSQRVSGQLRVASRDAALAAMAAWYSQ